jgi:hypothetical protein
MIGLEAVHGVNLNKWVIRESRENLSGTLASVYLLPHDAVHLC